MNNDQNETAKLREQLEGIWPHPGPKDTWMFLVTEIAEVGDILLRMPFLEDQPTYIRNAAIADLEAKLEMELGDVMIMLCTLANHFEIDLSYALDRTINKIKAKLGR